MQIDPRQFELRDRLRRRYSAQLTPEQRIQQLDALLEECSELLAQNPEAMARFWRRNLKKRAVRRDPTRTP
jgi:hypothetical protein